MVVITGPDMLLTVTEAAEVAGVKADRIRKWDRRGHLERAGLNDRGWALYRAVDVAKCQHRFAGHGHGEQAAA